MGKQRRQTIGWQAAHLFVFGLLIVEIGKAKLDYQSSLLDKQSTENISATYSLTSTPRRCRAQLKARARIEPCQLQ